MKTILAAATAAAALALLAAGGASAASTPPVDTWWLHNSIQTDRFQIAAGRYAETQARTPEAKALAAQLVGDHMHALNEASGLATKLHVSIPAKPSWMERWLILTLQGKQAGTPYDQAYTSLEVQATQQAITNTKLEIAAGTTPSVAGLAKTELRALKVELMLSQKAWKATV